MAIDIGTAAILRDPGGLGNHTVINMGNPANAAGKITTVEIWATVTLTSVEVATFNEVSSGRFTTRDNESIANVVAGAKRTFSVNLDVEVGDYIGIYFATGSLSYEYEPGKDGMSWYNADVIPCINQVITFYPDREPSLYGKGLLTINITSTSNIATSITSTLTKAIKAITSTANIVVSITSALSRGITEALTSTSNIATSITSTLSRGVAYALTSTTNIATSITSVLSRGVTEALTSTANIATSITSTLTKAVTVLTSTVNIITSIIGKLLKDYISLTISDRTYTSVTKADKVYIPVSDITPSGTVEEKFIWNYINPNYDTWVELLAKEHWCDWLFATPFTDAWSSLITPTKTYTSVTAPSKTYNEVTKSDRTFTPITTPAKTYVNVSDVTPDGTIGEKFTWAYIDDNFDTWVELLAKEHWCDWYFATKFVDAWASKTTPSRTYTDVTKPEDGYSPVTTPDKEYKEVTKHQIDV